MRWSWRKLCRFHLWNIFSFACRLAFSVYFCSDCKPSITNQNRDTCRVSGFFLSSGSRHFIWIVLACWLWYALRLYIIMIIECTRSIPILSYSFVHLFPRLVSQPKRHNNHEKYERWKKPEQVRWRGSKPSDNNELCTLVNIYTRQNL